MILLVARSMAFCGLPMGASPQLKDFGFFKGLCISKGTLSNRKLTLQREAPLRAFLFTLGRLLLSCSVQLVAVFLFFSMSTRHLLQLVIASKKRLLKEP